MLSPIQSSLYSYLGSMTSLSKSKLRRISARDKKKRKWSSTIELMLATSKTTHSTTYQATKR